MFANRVVKARNRAVRSLAAKGRLTSRDREIIATVALYGATTRSLLVCLGYFASVSCANRRLRFLFDRNYLRRTSIAAGPYTVETVYVLGTNSVDVAAQAGVLDREELVRQARRQPERAYLEHQLGVLSLRVMLCACPSEVRVTSFMAEPECRHEYEIRNGTRVTRRLIKPDAYFEVEVDGQHVQSFFVEYDRGNCSVPQMRGVFERYDQYAKDGAFEAAYGRENFEVLVVTTAGERRISHLATVAQDCDVAVRFATVQDIWSQGFYSPIWRSQLDSGAIDLVVDILGRTLS